MRLEQRIASSPRFEYNALKGRCWAEVEHEPDLVVGCAQVVDELCDVHGGDLLNRFALDDDEIVDDEVDAIVANHVTAEDYRRGNLAPACDGRLFECDVHGFAICGLQKPRPSSLKTW